jgi:ribosome biogenesis GTPase
LTWKHINENKAMRAVRKQIKHNRKPDEVRQKDWERYDTDNLDAFYDLDVPGEKRVMPRGERERRRNVLAAAEQARRQEDGRDESEVEAPARPLRLAPGTHELQATVIEVSTGLCRVEAAGHNLICNLRGSLSANETGFTNIVAVGDEVIVSANGSDQGVVEAVLPRRTMLARPDVFYSHLQQVIAANVDQLLIVASWREPAFWPELVDRYLITAQRNHLAPILCVNKIDLAEDLAACRAALRPYAKLGYRAIFASALSGDGIDELRQALYGQTSVLAGLSGVGKSSLLSAVQPGLQLRTHEVSDRRHEGQHTTTQATMLKLDAGGYVVDTPGIREFGLSGLHRRDLAGFYGELALIGQHCRFNDCSHAEEPGCAVRPSVAAGWISAVRYESYKKIYASLPE